MLYFGNDDVIHFYSAASLRNLKNIRIASTGSFDVGKLFMYFINCCLVLFRRAELKFHVLLDQLNMPRFQIFNIDLYKNELYIDIISILKRFIYWYNIICIEILCNLFMSYNMGCLGATRFALTMGQGRTPYYGVMGRTSIA